MKHRHLRKTLVAILVATALPTMGSAYATIISAGDIQHIGTTTLNVGATASGSLTVNGGTMLDQADVSLGASGAVTLGVAAGSNGTGLVTGAGSSWIIGSAAAPNTPSGFFMVGNGGTARLTVEQGGTVIATQLIAGSSAGSNGAVIIDGAGSTIQTTGLSIVGPNGTGSLQITNGGKFTSTFSLSSQSALTLGSNSGGNGTVSVSGAGSKIEGRGILTVGLGPAVGPAAAGTLNITGGGLVEEASSQVAFASGATGNVTVSGAGSLLHLSSFSNQQTFMNVGRLGTGRLDVTAGGKILMDPTAGNATITSFNAFNIGGPGGGSPPVGAQNSNGTANVTGSGSEIRLAGNFSTVGVGRNGTGVLNITNGAQVIVEYLAGATFSAVGRANGANGTALVDGTGSLWQVGNKLFIGTEVTANTNGGSEAAGGGTGVLTVSNGGKVLAGSDVIVGAGGTLKGGGGAIQGNVINRGSIAPGNSPGIMTVIGNLALTSTGNLNIELGGASNANAMSPQYDQINVVDNLATLAQEGLVVVDGNVNVTFFGGFNPHAGDFFDILTGFDVTQINPQYFLPSLGADLGWDITEFTANGGEALRLTVVARPSAVPEPGAFMLLGIGLLGLSGVRRLRK